MAPCLTQRTLLRQAILGSQDMSWMKYGTMRVTNQMVPLTFQQLQFCMTCYWTDRLTCGPVDYSDKVFCWHAELLERTTVNGGTCTRNCQWQSDWREAQCNTGDHASLTCLWECGSTGSSTNATNDIRTTWIDITGIQRKMEQGKGAVSKLRAETVWWVLCWQGVKRRLLLLLLRKN